MQTMDFGYPWWLGYGHAVILIPAAALLVLGRMRGWKRWTMGLLALLALWAAASLVVSWRFGVNRVPSLPVTGFLPSGTGRVLDIGAGTGRSSIMVLRERPGATLVALDQFGRSFIQHFGSGVVTPQRRLLSNLQAAGVAERATIVAGDMRQLPFADAEFDAAVSAYAMDHLPRAGSIQALREAYRVLRPGRRFSADAGCQRSLGAIRVRAAAFPRRRARGSSVAAARVRGGLLGHGRGHVAGDPVSTAAAAERALIERRCNAGWQASVFE